MNDLRKLFDKYKCDKGYKHGYDIFYHKWFEEIRNDHIDFLEIGVFKGASTLAFLEYFPNATMWAVDLFERVELEDMPTFGHPRCRFIKGSSTDSKTLEHINRPQKFDIILDDGAHWPEANRLTLENFWPLVKDDGLYIIEDVWPLHRMSQKEMKHPWLTCDRNRGKYSEFSHNLLMESIESRDGITFSEHDFRITSGEPDSYIMMGQK